MSAHLAALTADLNAFRDYLAAERGMAKNTVLAYQGDLERYRVWVANEGLPNYLKPTVRELTNYLGYLRGEGLAAPSVARKTCSHKDAPPRVHIAIASIVSWSRLKIHQY